MNEGAPAIAKDVELCEREFLREIALLPKEIANRWMAEFDDLDTPTPAFFAKFQSFARMRNDALNSTVETESNLSDELRKEISRAIGIIRSTFGDVNYFLGNGSTAEVYEFPIAPHLCIKYIHNQEEYDKHNHLRREFYFLEELRGFIHEGIRTPIPYFIDIHPSAGHSYGMEHIKGKSLSQILERPEENANLIQLIKEMDRKKVEMNLVGYISALYSKFRITHGDLFIRNIMLDENGEFRIIDFGKAKQEELGEDNERFAREDIARLRSEIRLFFIKLDNLGKY
jgi:tRNA A-37 threonylcarbamoyl transferase component Bud32